MPHLLKLLTFVFLGAIVVGIIWLIVNIFRHKNLVAPIALILLAGFFLGISYSTYDMITNDEAKTEAPKKTKPKKPKSTAIKKIPEHAYGLNERAIIGNRQTQQKYFGLTIISINQNFDQYALDHKDVLFGNNFDNAVEITAKYTNYTLDKFLPSVFNFKIYDDAGSKGKVLNQQKGQDEIPAGQTATTTFWAVLPKPLSQTTKVELNYTYPETKVSLKYVIPIKK